ncbi:MAG: hypothetical protein HY059_14330 [Proteobacteria bacterium]|nr:hypothetical protein [Pseudomonadota bacterium]
MSDLAEQSAVNDTLMTQAPRAAAAPRRFDFAHKVFQVEDGIFQPDPATDEPVYSVDLGDVRASLTFGTLRISFGIDPDGADSRLLDEVAKALAFVKRIRPGDTIPSELLDGTASWAVTPQFRAIARGRVWVGLVAWLSGQKGVGEISKIELAKVSESAEARDHVNAAFGRLAEHLGYGAANKEMVVQKVERLVDELSYIEALRDRIARARRVVDVVKRLRAVYKRERSVREEIERIVLLIEQPVARLEAQVTEVDAQAGETSNALRNLLRQIEFIRRTRDRLHADLMKWDDILAAWHGVEAEPDQRTHKLVRNTYRFVARYFPAESEWVR